MGVEREMKREMEREMETTDISLLLIIGGLLFKLFPASVEDELLLCVGK